MRIAAAGAVGVVALAASVRVDAQQAPEAIPAFDASAAAEVDTVGRLMDRMIARALTEDEPTEEQLAISRVISDVWLANLVAWVTRRASATDVADRLQLTIGLLLGERKAQG